MPMLMLNFSCSVTKTPEALELVRRYERLMELLALFEDKVFNEWREKVPEKIELNLQKSLMTRDSSTKLLLLNFSPQLFAILKEVHYLKLMGKEGIPEIGIQFSEKSETYRSYTLSLERTIDWYNEVKFKMQTFKISNILRNHLIIFKILENSTKVELELIEEEIQTIDTLLEVGISELTWNSESM